MAGIGTAALCLLAAVAAELPGGSDSDGDWTPLFNGRDLAGWTVKIAGHELGDNYGETFRVEDGLLEVSYDRYDDFDGRFGHLFYGEELESYRLRVEYRFVGEQMADAPEWAFRNSGIMVHGQSPESMARDQEFPVSVEVQLLGGDGAGERPTANLCTPGTHVVMGGELVTRHCTDSESRTFRGDGWVTVVVEVHGNSIRHVVEGETVLEYTDPQLDDTDPHARRLIDAGSERLLRRGTISIQSESHPVEFRRIDLQRLPEPGATR